MIQEILRQRNISLRQLALDSGISASTLSRWARGKQTPSAQLCRQFALALSLPVQSVLAFAGHLVEDDEVASSQNQSYRQFARKKYPSEFDDDMIAMIENLILECYPSPRIDDVTV